MKNIPNGLSKYIELLLDPTLSEDQLADLWIHFICGVLPNIPENNALYATRRIAREYQDSCLDDRHAEIMCDFIEEFSNSSFPINEYYRSHFVGFMLAESCKISLGRQNNNWVFARIPRGDVGRELFDVMFETRDENFFEYLDWLFENGFMLDSFDNVSWLKMQRRLEPFYSGSRPVPFSVKSTTREEPVSDSLIRIHPSLSSAFPDLQQAIDEITYDPAFPSIYPTIGAIVHQVARNGGLNRFIVLQGPPGVGKTQGARLLVPVLHALGVSGKEFYTFSPGKDTQGTVDTMAESLRNKLNHMKNKGGVILMDEAHKMHEGGTDVNRASNFRKRTLDVVMEQQSDLLDRRVIIIFAGYAEGLEKTFEQDAGFSRRVWKLNIEVPTAEQLAHHVVTQSMRDNLDLPPGFREATIGLFSEMISNDSMQFGYWATADTFVESLHLASRGEILREGISAKRTLSADDFKEAARAIDFRNESFLSEIVLRGDSRTAEIERAIGALDEPCSIERFFGRRGPGDLPSDPPPHSPNND